MDKVILSIETTNKIMGYLGTRPYQEVFQLIEAIQKEAVTPAPVAEPETQPTQE